MSNNEYKFDEDFIGVYDNFISDQWCDDLIEYFDWCVENNKVWDRTGENGNTEFLKKDLAVNLNPANVTEITFCNDNLHQFIHEFNDCFWSGPYDHYSKQFQSLSQLARHTIYSYKLQKTVPAEGYHVWHCEHASRNSNSRILVYIVYLNDVEEAGETEFLYQKRRVSPKKGRCVIWPAGFTHPHRGNPPLTQSKYIMTGWIEFA
jgi:hypothetical protein